MRHGDGRFLLGLLGAIAFLYAPGLPGPPVYDDYLLGVYPLQRIPMLARFLDPVSPQPPGVPLPSYAYRPLTEASFALQQALGVDIPGLRLGNLLLHAACALLVFLVVRRLAALLPGSPLSPRWAALLFALHPLAVQAVTYVYQRAVLLETLLCLLTLLLYLVARTHPRPFRSAAYWAALASGLLAMTAKEPAVTLPLTLAALEWILREPGSSWKPTLSRWLPFALLPALVLLQVVRAGILTRDALLSVQGGFRESGFRSDPFGATPAQYFLLELPVLLGYLRLGALPFPLHFYHDWAYPAPGEPPRIGGLATLACAAALLGLAAWVLFGPRRHRAPRLALALFFTPLALESSFFPIRDIAFNHRCYPSLLGLGLLLAWALGRLPRLRLLAAGLLALLAALALSETRRWADPLALQRRDVRHAWHHPVAWRNLAWERLGQGHPERALGSFRQALRSPWLDAGACAGVASTLLSLGRDAEALQATERALAVFPDNAGLLGLAIRQARQSGDADRLEARVRQAESLDILTPELACQIAYYRVAGGKPEAAEILLRRQLGRYPTDPSLWDYLGWALSKQGRARDAADAFREALRLDPGNERARQGLDGLP